MANLILSPTNGATLSSRVSVRLNAADDTGTLSEYSLKLGGLLLDTPVLQSGVYILMLDTERYPNGPQTLVAQATHSTAGEVAQSITVTISNSLQSNVEYQAWQVENQREGEEITRANVHLKTFQLPEALRLQYWTQLRLLTEATPDAAHFGQAGHTGLEALGQYFAAAQPVTPLTSKFTPALGDRPEAQLRYASHVQLAYPGQKLTALLRLEPCQYLSWWTTGFERGVKLRRNPAECETGIEVWYALYRNLDGSDAGIFRFKVEGSLEEPTLTWEEAVDLTADCPDAFDFCIHQDKVYVLRESDALVYAFDRDQGDSLVAMKLSQETRKPRCLETCGETPVVVCVDEALTTNRSRAWQLVFPSFKPVWTLNEAVALTRPITGGTALELYAAAGTTLSSSTGGTSTPGAVQTFEDDITALGATDIYPIIGLESGEVWQQVGATWKLRATLVDAVLATGGWMGDGETLRAVAGREGAVLMEEGTDGNWDAGVTLSPPATVTETVARITALENFERLVTAASGTEGQPDFVPATYDRRLLILTGDGGLFTTLQRSLLSPLQAAFLSHEHNELTLVPLSTKISTTS